MANHGSRKAARRRAKFTPDWEKLHTHFSCAHIPERNCPKCLSRAYDWYHSACDRITAIHDREDADLRRRLEKRAAA